MFQLLHFQTAFHNMFVAEITVTFFCNDNNENNFVLQRNYYLHSAISAVASFSTLQYCNVRACPESEFLTEINVGFILEY